MKKSTRLTQEEKEQRKIRRAIARSLDTMDLIIKEHEQCKQGGIDRDDRYASAISNYFKLISSSNLDPEAMRLFTAQYRERDAKAQRIDLQYPAISKPKTGGGTPMADYNHRAEPQGANRYAVRGFIGNGSWRHTKSPSQ